MVENQSPLGCFSIPETTVAISTVLMNLHSIKLIFGGQVVYSPPSPDHEAA